MIYVSAISLKDINTPDCLKTRLLHLVQSLGRWVGMGEEINLDKGNHLDFSALYEQWFYFFNVPQ